MASKSRVENDILALTGREPQKTPPRSRIEQLIENLSVSAGGGDYSELDNKPSINGEILDGNKTLSDIGVIDAIQSAISQTNHLTKKVVDTLPDVSDAIDEVLYLVPTDKSGYYRQYTVIYNNGYREFISLGTTEVDLTNYYTKSETYSSTEVNDLIGAIPHPIPDRLVSTPFESLELPAIKDAFYYNHFTEAMRPWDESLLGVMTMYMGSTGLSDGSSRYAQLGFSSNNKIFFREISDNPWYDENLPGADATNEWVELLTKTPGEIPITLQTVSELIESSKQIEFNLVTTTSQLGTNHLIKININRGSEGITIQDTISSELPFPVKAISTIPISAIPDWAINGDNHTEGDNPETSTGYLYLYLMSAFTEHAGRQVATPLIGMGWSDINDAHEDGSVVILATQDALASVADGIQEHMTNFETDVNSLIAQTNMELSRIGSRITALEARILALENKLNS